MRPSSVAALVTAKCAQHLDASDMPIHVQFSAGRGGGGGWSCNDLCREEVGHLDEVTTQTLPIADLRAWNSKDFWRLADSRGLFGCDQYVNSLTIKLDQFLYHAGYFKLVANNLLEKTAAGSITGHDIQTAMFEMETHVEAAMHASYSAVDILCQVVNATALDHQIPEDDVGLQRTIKELSRKARAHRIHTALTKLDGCAEFAYFYAFANTSKHRRAVRSGNTIMLGEDGSRVIAVHMQEVRGRKGNFPGESFEVIMSEKEPALRARIADVLLEINAYLAALPEKPAATGSSH